MADDTTMDALASIRREYDAGALEIERLPEQPLPALRAWVTEAVEAGELEPTAMVLATSTATAAPSARTVLLKGVDEVGLVFYTSYRSRKGRELAANPRCAAVLRWDRLHRQVTVRGVAVKVEPAVSDAYFASRPRGSQVAAWASEQSAVIDDREALEARVANVEAQFPREVERPPWWGGYRIEPEEVELWQGRPSRLHDRVRWRRAARPDGPAWIVERLSP